MRKEFKLIKNGAFLTSIVILLLTVIAVSTSTFAWFSASNIVNVTTISFTANSDTQGTDGIMYINWDKNDKSPNYQIDFDTTDFLDPMIPLNLPVLKTTNYTDFIRGFTSSSESDGVYNMDGYMDIAPLVLKKTISSGSAPLQDFYLHNTNEKLPLKVSVTFSLEGALADKICVAVFVDRILQYIICNDVVYYGNIVAGELVDRTPSVDLSDTVNSSFIINENSSAQLNMVAWLNGVSVKNSDISKTVSLTNLQFKGAYTTK